MRAGVTMSMTTAFQGARHANLGDGPG